LSVLVSQYSLTIKIKKAIFIYKNIHKELVQPLDQSSCFQMNVYRLTENSFFQETHQLFIS
jgi:hypothetical protein